MEIDFVDGLTLSVGVGADRSGRCDLMIVAVGQVGKKIFAQVQLKHKMKTIRLLFKSNKSK